MQRKPWPHKPICTQITCYCLDEGEGDPICVCGNPGWACRCDEMTCDGTCEPMCASCKEQGWVET